MSVHAGMMYNYNWSARQGEGGEVESTAMGQTNLAKLRRYLIISLLVIADILTVSMAPYLSLWLRFDGVVEQVLSDTVWSLLPLIICTRIAVFYVFRLYHRMWRYASINELIVILMAVSVSSLLIYSLSHAMGAVLPRSIWV